MGSPIETAFSIGYFPFSSAVIAFGHSACLGSPDRSRLSPTSAFRSYRANFSRAASAVPLTKRRAAPRGPAGLDSPGGRGPFPPRGFTPPPPPGGPPALTPPCVDPPRPGRPPLGQPPRPPPLPPPAP